MRFTMVQARGLRVLSIGLALSIVACVGLAAQAAVTPGWIVIHSDNSGKPGPDEHGHDGEPGIQGSASGLLIAAFDRASPEG